MGFLKSSSSSVAELGRAESNPVISWRRLSSPEKEELQLPVEQREAVVVSEEEEELEEAKRVRTMEMRGERWRGRSWPL